ncbi:hypothetical protein Afil01_59780 [Actinorhabdospora filicis]|uniref:SHOCT domain-containing protein n=1 Tax=Actinorhabdospora filicis TaxID=1785913 RepID=A0A9W6WD22_9ACTN|nr:SHOCT domain-containing protein [Actinorhabdospora filicis]GLZ81171.1 hypothetical protein Afil01_59780 [Actinorhabdospora filicis]
MSTPDDPALAESIGLAVLLALALGEEAARTVLDGMEPDEGFLAITAGTIGGEEVALILTRRRLLLIAGDDDPESIDLADITGVDWRMNVLRGTLSVYSRVGGFAVDKVDRKEGPHFVAAARGVIGGPPSAVPAADSPEAVLQRLADLHARGLITDAEYAGKRAEVLRRL